MNNRIPALLIGTTLLMSVLVAGPGSASTSTATITGSNGTQSCFSGDTGTCSASASADPTGSFSASAELTSQDSPLSRSTRYSMGLARYTIGFDLPTPTREAVITVALQLDDASASWAQDVPEIFGGTQDAASGAKVLFQLLGDEAPDGCGCGWPSQGSSNAVVVEAAEVGEADSASDIPVQLTMTARNPYGDNLLPAGHYEILLRAYALADLVGTGDWGTVSAAMSGRIESATVSIPATASNLDLSVAGNGANRTLTAVLTDTSSVPIDGRTISFFGDGELLGTGVTQDGMATFPLEGKFRGGSRLFRAEFAGDDAYGPASSEIGP